MTNQRIFVDFVFFIKTGILNEGTLKVLAWRVRNYKRN